MYQNLKREISLNVLTEQDKERLWLPWIVYINTDQKEATRLGALWEWKTDVTVTREGQFFRSNKEAVDEAEIFKGPENRLTMLQTYTKELQCAYKLQRYPFDTQVKLICWFLNCTLPRSVTFKWKWRGFQIVQ